MAPERKLIAGKGSNNKVSEDIPDDGSASDDDAMSTTSVAIPEIVSPLDRDILNAKLELMKTSIGSNVSLYQHLAEVLSKVLDERPPRVTECIEILSAEMKIERTHTEPVMGAVEAHPDLEPQLKGEWRLYKTIGRQVQDVREPHKPQPEDLTKRLAILPNLMKECHLFNIAGLGLPACEYTRIAVAMRELALEWPLKSIRFWGKILGTHQNYYIVETEFLDSEDSSVTSADEIRKMNEAKPSNPEDFKAPAVLDDDEDDIDDDEVPVMYNPPVKIPAEPSGQGVNAQVYFVCNEPGLEWTKLPNVTPEQIVVARKIASFFTGDLDHVHATYPPFPGTETNYLRAQIARISSATSVSPIGYFKFDEEAEEEEEHAEASREICVKDDDFEGVPTRDLGDSSMNGWVHHGAYILPQGRTTWFNPVLAKEAQKDEEDEDDEEEERTEPDEPEPEIPMPLLVPLSEDVEMDNNQAWTARLISQFVPEHSPVSVHSLRWPGAVAVTSDRGKFFAYMYVGFGQKALQDGFEPSLLPEPRMEFPTGPEVLEMDDPTPGEEAAMKAAMGDAEDAGAGRKQRKHLDDDDEEEEEEEEMEEEADDDEEDGDD